MNKFIFKNKINLSTSSVPEGSAEPYYIIEFKKGDIFEGEIKPNAESEQPPYWLIIKHPKGDVKIGVGGKVQPAFIVPVDKNVELPISEEAKNLKQAWVEKYFTPKNIIIGLIGIGAVIGLLKWKKVF